ncbi:MAG: NAD(P)/FAD-dependent oxidoreductase [Pseudomonadota bacterium]
MSAAVEKPNASQEFDVVIVGAGFAGLYLIHSLRKQGFRVRAYEAGTNVGGTWYWNRYPGCRVDIVSMEYSYQFSEELQQDWEWSEKYATQPELLAYANHVADRFDLRRDIQFQTSITAATFNETTGRWLIETDDGASLCAQYFVLATGTLSRPNKPDFPGIDAFTGDIVHTGLWPHGDIDLDGKRVAIIGTGSSACQSIPHLAERASHLTVFQRTANYVIPAHNETLDPELVNEIKAEYPAFRAQNLMYPFAFSFESTNKSALEVSDEEREAIYESAWATGGLMFLGIFNDLLFDKAANKTAQDFFRRKLKAVVKDPQTAEKLMPDFMIGCKRLIVGTEYYETYNRDNVELVSVKETPIDGISAHGVVVQDREYPADVLVLATGFDAIAGPILKIDVRGRDGVSIRDKWADGPRCYLGLSPGGFPNLFTVTGPGSPSVLSNMLKSIEQHVDFITNAIVKLRDDGQTTIESNADAEEAWMLHVDDIASASVYKSCNSWYLGSNIPGKPRVFTSYLGWPQYDTELKEIVEDDYRGFTITNTTQKAPVT